MRILREAVILNLDSEAVTKDKEHRFSHTDIACRLLHKQSAGLSAREHNLFHRQPIEM